MRIDPTIHYPAGVSQGEPLAPVKHASMSDIIDAFARIQQLVDDWTQQLGHDERAKIAKIVDLYEQKKDTTYWQGWWTGTIGIATGSLKFGASYYPIFEAISELVGKGLAQAPQTVYENRKTTIDSELSLSQRFAQMVKEMMSTNQQFFTQMFQTLQTIQSTKAQEANR